MARRHLALALGLVFAPACLDNLNEQKFFDLLERAEPGQWKNVVRHRERVDEQLRTILTEGLTQPIERVGLWGETWDAVRGVGRRGEVVMRGRIFHTQGPSTNYILVFSVDEHGAVTVSQRTMIGPAALQLNARSE